MAAVEGLGGLGYAQEGAYLRGLAQTPGNPLRRAAVFALGGLRDVTDFRLLFALLDDPDDVVAREARCSLQALPLTPEQHRQVEVEWAGQMEPTVR